MEQLDENQRQFLSVFKNLGMIIVKQEAELLEAFINFETANQYRVYDEIGRFLLQVGEESDCLTRQCCTSGRAHMLHVMDNNLNEVLTLRSPWRPCMGPFCFACCDPCSHQIHVYCCNKRIGYVEESCSLIQYTFRVYRDDENPVFTINAPLCRWDACCCDDVYYVYDYQGSAVAQIRKKFAGIGKEVFTDADTFGVQLPRHMHVLDKALLFAATFLIDFMFYENNNKSDNMMDRGIQIGR
ncbi:phospholipid scramblase 1 [Biomphalaria glabrata]|uniref:Phospholipid scramblase n=2 Tax=Biomphalaria glabrata TaxID=6526 RepID=A0A9W2ZJX0_BIOGL|nr:phospholipid scramblase 2-like isoform X1 [Biomphalaria glabrata]KAI8766444.1 phospholipid scramblase 1-like [Biomphalaria glabrata]